MNNKSTDQSDTGTQQDNGTKTGPAKKNTTTSQSNDTNSSTETKQPNANQSGAGTKSGASTTTGNNAGSTDKPNQNGQSGTTGDTTESGSTATKPAGNTQVQVSVEQQTQIREAVKEVHVAPVRETDFTVSVGTRIPRKIELEPLPPRIVKIVPQYRSYRFFVLADGRIVIVDPSTFEIVYIIDA